MPKAPFSPVIFQNAAGQLAADPAGFLRMNWSNQPRRLPDTQALLQAMAQALHEHSWSRILANQTAIAPFSPEEQHWISTEWLPGAVRDSGYRFGAIVVSANVLARLATAYITTNVQGLELHYRSFDSEEAAVSWLLRQHE